MIIVKTAIIPTTTSNNKTLPNLRIWPNGKTAKRDPGQGLSGSGGDCRPDQTTDESFPGGY